MKKIYGLQRKRAVKYSTKRPIKKRQLEISCFDGTWYK